MEINIDWLIAARAIAVAETALILALLFKQRESTIVLRLSQLIAGCVLCYILSEAYPSQVLRRFRRCIGRSHGPYSTMILNGGRKSGQLSASTK